MARGKPRISPEQKAAKKERVAADKASALAANALAKLPAEKERRDELWQELEACKTASATATGEMSAHKKRMTEVFGITKAAIKIRGILDACKAGEYEATVEQVTLFMQDTNRPFQFSMKLEPGKGVAEDEGSVFDKTGAGDHVAAERGDDPGRAQRRSGQPPTPTAAPTPGIPLDEAEAKFKEAKEAGDAKRAARKGPPAPAAEPAAKPADDFADGKDVRPRHLKEAEAERARQAEVEKAKAAEIATENMTPAQRKAHAKKIANEVFAKGREKDDSGDAPGTYRVQ